MLKNKEILILEKKLKEFKTKYKEGFTNTEVEEFLKLNYSDITIDNFNKKFGFGHTVALIDNETVLYLIDVYYAILGCYGHKKPCF